MVADHMNTLVPFGVLMVNTAFFGILRAFLGKPRDPSLFQWIIMELAATMELCADCAELDVIFEIHGTIAFSVTLFILCFWWCQTWDKAGGTPCEPVEDLVLRQDTYKTIAARLVGQLIAIKIAYRYAQLIWSYHLTPEHKLFHQAKFIETPLQVNIYWGFAIEAATTLISRFIQLRSGYLDNAKVGFINSLTTVLLVLTAMNSTGGFFNPALASALKFGCSGTKTWHFILVYWGGSILGSLVARVMYDELQRRKARKPRDFRRSSTPGRRNSSTQGGRNSMSYQPRKYSH